MSLLLLFQNAVVISAAAGNSSGVSTPIATGRAIQIKPAAASSAGVATPIAVGRNAAIAAPAQSGAASLGGGGGAVYAPEQKIKISRPPKRLKVWKIGKGWPKETPSAPPPDLNKDEWHEIFSAQPKSKPRPPEPAAPDTEDEDALMMLLALVD